MDFSDNTLPRFLVKSTDTLQSQEAKSLPLGLHVGPVVLLYSCDTETIPWANSFE